MSSLTATEKSKLENLFDMSGGYVWNFSDATFGTFIADVANVDIHDQKYQTQGSSKAKKMREFWRVEPDFIVGKVVLALVEHVEKNLPETANAYAEKKLLFAPCKGIATRLLAEGPSLDPLKLQADVLNANHLKEQIRRMEAAVEGDPSLAIGTAKELIETCCKTILAERGKPVTGTPDVSTLTKETLKELKLVPEGIPNAARGADVIKRLLSNLGTIGNGLAELRGLYGTGHGKHGNATSLGARHAKLAVGAAATLAIFLFETHAEGKQ